MVMSAKLILGLSMLYAHKGRMEADRMGRLLEACCFACITSFIMKPALYVKEWRPREVK